MQKVFPNGRCSLPPTGGSMGAGTGAVRRRTLRWGPHMMGWGGGWYAMIFGPLFMILFLAVLVAVVVVLVRWLGGPWQGTYPPHQLPPPARRSISSRSALRAARSTRRSSRTGGAFSANNSARRLKLA